MQEIYGDEGLALGFTAPVRDRMARSLPSGGMLPSSSVVEEIISSYYRTLKEQGLGSAEITLLDKAGNVIVDYDPTTNGSDKIVRDMSVIGKFNLVEKGVEAAVNAANGEPGSITRSLHARKQIQQTAGYAPLDGALGFPGMGWNVLVRVACDEALATTNQLKQACI